MTNAVLWESLRGDEVLGPGQAVNPSLSSPGRAIELPYSKTRHANNTLVNFAYTITLPEAVLGLKQGAASDSQTPTHGVLFTQIINGGDFYLNGTWVAGLARSTDTEQWLWHQPLLIPLPPHLLNTDGQPNVLLAVQSSYEPRLRVFRPYVGPMADLEQVKELAFWITKVLSNAARLWCIAIGIFILCAWLVSPHEKMYAFGGLITIMWALVLILANWHYLPVHLFYISRGIVLFGFGWLTCLTSLFVLSYIDELLPPKILLQIGIYVGLGPVLYFLGGSLTQALLTSVWLGGLVLLYAYAFFRLMRFYKNKKDMQAMALVLQTLVCLLVAYHDLSVMNDSFNTWLPVQLTWRWWTILTEPIYLMSLAVPTLSMTMGYILLKRFQAQAQTVANANVYLQARLTQREAELQQSYEQQKRLALVEATRTERDRIYQDVHDGIGSRLVNAMFSLRKGQSDPQTIESHLKDCLSDLRLVINAQTDETVDLQSAIFDHCLLQETHVEGSGLAFSYDVGDGPPIYLSAQVHLNILRILQESITNAIKHAHATEIHVQLVQSQDALVLSVTDNGVGPNAAAANPDTQHYGGSGQRGLVGMRARAKTIGAQFSLARIHSQTRAQLSVPWVPAAT